MFRHGFMSLPIGKAFDGIQAQLTVFRQRLPKKTAARQTPEFFLYKSLQDLHHRFSCSRYRTVTPDVPPSGGTQNGQPLRLWASGPAAGEQEEKSSVTASAGMISPGGLFQQGPAALGRGGEGSAAVAWASWRSRRHLHIWRRVGQRPENGLRRAGLASGVIEFGAQVPIGVVLLLCLPK